VSDCTTGIEKKELKNFRKNMNIDIMGEYFLGNGGIGDFLLLLSTFYDDIPEDQKANVIFLANNPEHIKELYKLFPKLGKVLIIKNDWQLLHELYTHKNCIGTGILPLNLHYAKWHKVNIFKEYKVKEFPEFVKLFEPQREAQKQLVLQQFGSQVEGNQKQRSLTQETVDQIKNEFSDYLIQTIPVYNNSLSLSQIFSMIRGSDLVIGCDSFAKTWSAMCGIKTIVYDNIYINNYLDNFIDKVDAGHYVFIYPFSKIKFITQIESHKKSYIEFRKNLNERKM
jgi:hypothetical protein